MGFVESENGTEEEDLSKRFQLVYATLKCEKYVVSRSEENFSLDQVCEFLSLYLHMNDYMEM